MPLNTLGSPRRKNINNICEIMLSSEKSHHSLAIEMQYTAALFSLLFVISGAVLGSSSIQSKSYE